MRIFETVKKRLLDPLKILLRCWFIYQKSTGPVCFCVLVPMKEVLWHFETRICTGQWERKHSDVTTVGRWFTIIFKATKLQLWDSASVHRRKLPGLKMDWFHCNECFTTRGSNFAVSSCGHIYCEACIQSSKTDLCTDDSLTLSSH